jgi:hypothetical protein
VEYITGSSINGSLNSNTHLFTGSVSISGSSTFALNVNSGSLFVSASGQVGIGNIIPAYTLDVSGTVRGTTSAYFSTASGNVGIGTTSANKLGADKALTINGATDSLLELTVGDVRKLQMYHGGTNAQLNNLAAGSLTLITNGISALTLASTGAATFSNTVTGNDIFSAYSGFRNYTGGAARGGMYTYATITGTGTDYSNTLFAETGYSIYFCPNGSVTKVMTITTDGYTKMSSNGTNVSAGGYYHECYGGAANGYTLIVASPVVSPASQYVFDIRFTASTPNNTSARFLNCSDSTSTKAYIRSNGGLSNYQANNTDLSDIRTKKDIISLESYWNKFKALEIVKYKYKDQVHDDYNIGVIAQQVESVAPEFVDVDGWSKNDIESESPLKSIYTKDLYHATIKVLQEAMAKIETLQTQNDALQSRIETLESK